MNVGRSHAGVPPDRIEAELDAVYQDYLAKLGDTRSATRGTAYARFSTQFQDSIADQIRFILDWAASHGILVARQHLFYDTAVSGKKQRRVGIQNCKAVLESRQVECVLFFSTSRLFRNRTALPELFEEITQKWKCRCVFTAQNLDSADPKTEMMLPLFGWMDEYFTKASVTHIQSAHIGLFEDGFVFGTETYGYTGIPVEGLTTRLGKPKRKLAIDEVTSKVVQMIFHWFGVDGLTIEEIARRLYRSSYPVPEKATAGWTTKVVGSILRNERYRGDWSYGKTKSRFLRKEDYTRQEPRDKPLGRAFFEHLRIVSDELWFTVQQRLPKPVRPSGRPPKDSTEKRPRLIEGLLFCPTHDRPLVVGGAHGKSLRCPICRRLPAGERPLFTHLRRDHAERQLLQFMAATVVQNEAAVDELVEQCRLLAEAAVLPDPQKLGDLERQVKSLTTKIDFNRRNVGEAADEQAETERILRDLISQRRVAQTELDRLLASAAKQPKILTRSEILARLEELDQIFAGDRSNDPDVIVKLRRALELITGGRIDLQQRGERQEKKGWLVGHCSLRLLGWVQGADSLPAEANEFKKCNVTIEFRDDPQWLQRATKIKILIENGTLAHDVAQQLKIQTPAVNRLYHRWYTHHGLPIPESFQRLSRKSASEQTEPIYRTIAAEVQRLADEGHPLQVIAERLDVDRNTITAAMKYLAKQRGERPMDGRARRKALRIEREKRNDENSKNL